MVGTLVFLGLLGACASSPTLKDATVTTRRPQADKAFVRKVEFSGAPEMRELAERARRIGNEMYPKVLALLADDSSRLPRQFDIVFKKHLGSPGVTSGRTIRLNAGWLANSPVYLDTVLGHEMAHVAQDHKWYRKSKTHWYWQEGIADYVRCKLGYTNGWGCPQCSQDFPHYTSGWSCAGAFLLYLDTAYGSNIVRQLNAALRRGSYSERFFANATGRPLDELWAEFQKTPAFTPIAGQLNELKESLGNLKRTSPEEVQARFEAYLRQHHTGAEMNKLYEALGYVNGQPPKDVGERYKDYLYFGRPAGALTEEAVEFLQSLEEKGQLPGIPKDDQQGASLTIEMSPQAFSSAYPILRTFYLSDSGDPSLYYYVVGRESEGSAWKLQKAWRTGPDGRVVEEFSVR
jgi:hypothetical protein